MSGKRIKLAEAMGWRPGWMAGWRTKHQGLPADIWSPPNFEGSMWHTADELPDPFNDVKDDYAVLLWMRGDGEVETPAWRKFKDTMLDWATSHSWNYKVGDWARAALQTLAEREGAKPWDQPGALPRYRDDGRAHYPEHECGCMAHYCEGECR